MKLFYSPGACSLSPHIALIEAGAEFQAVKVGKDKQTEDGRDFRDINPFGYVPALELDDGSVLTEGPAIVQYLADRAPQKKLAPANGTIARYQLQEWLNFITSELHKQFSPLFDPSMPDEAKEKFRGKIRNRFEWINEQLGDKPFLMGDDFTVADAYLFTVANWSKHTGIDLARWPKLQAYLARVTARPDVQTALKEEGLLK